MSLSGRPFDITLSGTNATPGNESVIFRAFNYCKELFVVKELEWLWWGVFVYPLENFFLNGLWRGMPLRDICAAIAQTPSEFWSHHELECWNLVYREFNSWVAYVHFITYVMIIFTVLIVCTRKLCRKS